MQMPLNIGEVMKAAADTDAARRMPISISIFFDCECDDNLIDCVAGAFATNAPAARVTMQAYPVHMPQLDFDTDLAVLVAGLSQNTGVFAQRLRHSGVPVLVVTDMPQIVTELAIAQGHALLEDDLVFPSAQADGALLPADRDLNSEPYALTCERRKSLLSRMGDWVVSTFKDKRLAFALAFDFVRRPLSMDFVNATAVQNAAIGMVVVSPGADMPVMTLNQAKMVLQIAAAYGQDLGRERAIELIGVVGGGFACRAVARQLAAMVPSFGWLVKGGVGFTGTIAMGYGCIAYFESLLESGLSAEDALEAARSEAAKAQAIARGHQSPVDAAAAVAKMLAYDAATVGVEKARAFMPFMRNALIDIRDNADFIPVDLGRTLIASLLDLRKEGRE